MIKNLVSIIIPYYKKKNFFSETFYSAINQSYKKIEIIIIYDDKDTKDLKFIKKTIGKRKNVKLIIKKENLGLGISRNSGINISNGEYLAFLDSDDKWKRDKLEKQIKFMKQNNFIATHTSYYIINENNKILSQRISKKKIDHSSLKLSCDIGLSSVVLKKVKNITYKFPNLKTKEDYVLWLNLTKKRINFFGINEKLVYWRKTDQSLSSNVSQKMKDGFVVYKKYLGYGNIKSIFYLLILSLNFLKKSLL